MCFPELSREIADRIARAFCSNFEISAQPSIRFPQRGCKLKSSAIFLVVHISTRPNASGYTGNSERRRPKQRVQVTRTKKSKTTSRSQIRWCALPFSSRKNLSHSVEPKVESFWFFCAAGEHNRAIFPKFLHDNALLLRSSYQSPPGQCQVSDGGKP